MPRHGDRRLVALACVAALVAVVAVGAYAQPNQAPRPQVYVGDSPEAQDLVDQARTLRQQNRLLEAVALYQQVIERYPDKLLEVNGVYCDAPRRVDRDLAADPALLKAYQQNFEPLAQRALAAASNPLSIAALQGVVARYRNCPSGLEAGLRVAGLFLERGDTVDAGSILDQLQDHPDLPGVAGRWHYLQAATALLSRHQDRYEEQRGDLAPPGDRAYLASLTRMAANLRLPPEAPGFDLWDQPPQTGSDISTRQLLWQVAIPDAINDAARSGPSGPSGLGGGAWGPGGPGGLGGPGPGMMRRMDMDNAGEGYMLPQADADRIYVNCRDWIVAMDRLSGRVVWECDSGEPSADTFNQLPWGRMGARQPEQRGFAFADERVWTILGSTSPLRLSVQPSESGTALVCLDRSTGDLLYRVEPKDIDEALASASFVGTPAAVAGRVFVLVRRAQLSGFQDAFLACMDARTGKPLWHRYLSSAAAINRGTTSNASRLLVDAGRLYVNDCVGAVACLDVRTGSVYWLSILPDAFEPAFNPMRGAIESWQVSQPVLVEAGLIVPPSAFNGPPTLLDPRTGKVLQRLGQAIWTDADYFTRSGRDVLVIGATIRLVDGATLQERWAHTLGGEQPTRPQGRAAVTADRILIPVTDHIVVLRPSDGKELPSQPLALPGNLLALDDQLIVADEQNVRDFMEWDRAYARLKEAIAAHPANPRPGVALAYLALNTGRNAPLLEGVDLALGAVLRGARTITPAQQHAIFIELLGLGQSNTADAGVRRQVFARLEGAISGPGDEVAYELARGDLEAQTGHPEQAVDRYEAVLMDHALASQVFDRATGARLAGFEAQARLEAVVRKAGPGVYAHYDALATQRLAELSNAAPDPAALLELAQAFPLAHAVPKALAGAAAALEARGDNRGAELELRRAYTLATDGADLGRIAGQLTALMVHQHQARRAMRWLERVGREHPGLSVLRDNLPVGIDAWVADLARQPSHDMALPSLALPLGQPLMLPGHLLTPVVQPEDTWPRDLILLVEGHNLVLRAGPTLAKRWELPLDDPQSELLALTRNQALLWSNKTGVLLAVDVGSGKPAWPAPAIQAALTDAGSEARRRAARNPQERMFNRMMNPQDRVIRHGRVMTRTQIEAARANGVFVELNDWVVCIGDRNGRAVGIDRQTGRVLWRQYIPMDEVTDLELTRDALLAVGVDGEMSDAPYGVLMVLDPTTGESRIPPLEDREQITWAGVAGEGTIVYATATDVVARRSEDGGVAWRMSLAPEQPTPRIQLCDDLLFMTEGTAGMVVIDPATGQTLHRLTGLPENAGPPQVRGQDQQWQVLLSQQALALGPDGNEKWRDALTPFSKLLLHQLIGDRCVVLLGRGAQGMAPLAANVQEGVPALVIPVPAQPGVVNVPLRPGGGAPAPAPAPAPHVQVAPPAWRNNVQILQPRRGNFGGRVPWVWQGAADPEPDIPPMQRLEHWPPDQANPMEPQFPPVEDAGPGPLTYKLYVLDRFSGAIREERDLLGVPDAIQPQHAVFLDNRIVLTTDDTVIVVPGAH